MKNYKTLTKEELYNLPKDIVTKVLNTLKAYDECDIVYENGEYRIGACCLTKYYAPDHKYIGLVKQEDIYTIEERIENYKNEFGCEPYYLKRQLNK